MCVVIIQGKRRDVLTETGINWDMLCDEDSEFFEMKEGNEYSFFSSNLGKHKLFPGGPSWYFNGIEVPAFVTFTDHGGIDDNVLTEILQRIDNLAIYDAD